MLGAHGTDNCLRAWPGLTHRARAGRRTLDSGWRYPALFGIQRGLSSVLRFCRHPLFTIGAILVLFSGRTDSQHQYNVTPGRRGRVGRRVADDRAGSARELISAPIRAWLESELCNRKWVWLVSYLGFRARQLIKAIWRP